MIARTATLALLTSLALPACNPGPRTYTSQSGFSVLAHESHAAGPECPDDASVTVDVVITLPDDRVVDSTLPVDPERRAEHVMLRQAPMTFALSDVPPGLRELITGMRRNQTRLATIPPSLLYGAEGRPPRIPPNTPLTYSVTLLDFSTP